MRSTLLAALTLAALAAPAAAQSDLETARERASSDDAEDVAEAAFHGMARANVIMHLSFENPFGVGGREFRVKRHPAGEGAFVYHPQTRFGGAERFLVWFVTSDGEPYPLNSPSRQVTPERPFPLRVGVEAPPTPRAVDYVFRGEPWPSN